MTKFIIIIPEDCYCSDSLHDADEEIIFHADIEYRATRAGIIDRSYKSCMYKIKDKERHLVGTNSVTRWHCKQGQLLKSIRTKLNLLHNNNKKAFKKERAMLHRISNRYEENKTML